MLAMQAGTASDVSFLADFLPSFLFPDGEAEITLWAVTGISLGGHSTWIVLRSGMCTQGIHCCSLPGVTWVGYSQILGFESGYLL